MKMIFETLAAVLLSVGSAGAIIFGLSSWLGKIWANRILEKDKTKYKTEIEELKNKLSRELEYYKNQIELYKLTLLRYSEHQFNLYNKLWVSLAELKIAGDTLWDRVDKDSILDFGAKVKKAKESLLQNALLIEEEHEIKLNDLLEKFSNYEIGKYKLIELDKKLKDYNFLELLPGISDALERRSIVQENNDTKNAYDELLLVIKASFKKQLREGVVADLQI